jgi:DhnA family fructose-bisphosphate aldolase class Ia
MTVDELVPALAAVRDMRARDPEEVHRRYAERTRRPLMGEDGRLLVIALDHPARGALGARGNAMAMARRDDVLARLVTALSRPGVDGVLGTADVLDDLLLLGALEGKVAIGSMNRGGLQGAAYELDDRFTGYDTQGIVEQGLDGGKMLCRIDLDDAGSLATLESCGRAVSELSRARVMAMVEPFWSRRVDGKVVNDLSTQAVIRSVAVASGLGAHSAHTWLKLPAVPEMDEVMAATTLPALVLGGDPTEHPAETYASWTRALAAPGVRGLVIGRALLFPPDGDVAAAVDAAAELVHG